MPPASLDAPLAERRLGQTTIAARTYDSIGVTSITGRAGFRLLNVTLTTSEGPVDAPRYAGSTGNSDRFKLSEARSRVGWSTSTNSRTSAPVPRGPGTTRRWTTMAWSPASSASTDALISAACRTMSILARARSSSRIAPAGLKALGAEPGTVRMARVFRERASVSSRERGMRISVNRLTDRSPYGALRYRVNPLTVN